MPADNSVPCITLARGNREDFAAVNKVVEGRRSHFVTIAKLITFVHEIDYAIKLLPLTKSDRNIRETLQAGRRYTGRIARGTVHTRRTK